MARKIELTDDQLEKVLEAAAKATKTSFFDVVLRLSGMAVVGYIGLKAVEALKK